MYSRNLDDFIKELYENSEVQKLAERHFKDFYSNFWHVSNANTRYCPVAWVMAEKILEGLKKLNLQIAQQQV